MRLKGLTEGLVGSPSYHTFLYHDRNPLGRTEKRRQLHAPNPAMRVVLHRFIVYLRRVSKGKRLPCATACYPKASPLGNVYPHKANRFFYLTDVQNAFPSVDGPRLAEMLCQLDPQLSDTVEDVFAFLQEYCLAPSGGLCVGGNAAPDLFNLYAGQLLDQRITVLCQRHGICYTRYLDDLTFSSNRRIGKRVRRAIQAIVLEAGFAVNHRKSIVGDLKKGPITITGVGLQYGGRIYLPGHYLRKIRGLIHLVGQGRAPLSRLQGMMGAFWHLTARRPLNRTERKLIASYRAMLREVKGGR